MDVEFAHQARAVGVNRLDGDSKGVGDFAVGLALGDKLENLPLPRGQLLVGVVAAPAETLKNPPGKARRQVQLASGDGAKGLDELVVVGLLGQVARSAVFQRPDDKLLIVVHAQDQNRQFSHPPCQFSADVQAVDPGHDDVQHQHIRLGGLDLLGHLQPIPALADNLELRLPGDHLRQGLAHHRMVIRQEDSDSSSVFGHVNVLVRNRTWTIITSTPLGCLVGNFIARTSTGPVPPPLARYYMG